MSTQFWCTFQRHHSSLSSCRLVSLIYIPFNPCNLTISRALEDKIQNTKFNQCTRSSHDGEGYSGIRFRWKVCPLDPSPLLFRDHILSFHCPLFQPPTPLYLDIICLFMSIVLNDSRCSFKIHLIHDLRAVYVKKTHSPSRYNYSVRN